jgi:hypothetical protein
MVQFYTVMNQEEFNPELANRASNEFLTCYSQLAQESWAKGLRTWAIKPKFHLFAHLGEEQCWELGNPRLFWAYTDEDFMGALGRMGRPRGGSQGKNMVVKLMEKYRAWSS